MTTTRRTALLSGLATITGAFVPRLVRRGLPAAALAEPIDWPRFGDSVAASAAERIRGRQWFLDSDFGVELRVFTASAHIRAGQLVALRPDGTVGPAT